MKLSDFVPYRFKYPAAWVMVRVFKSKNKTWISEYRIKHMDDGYIVDGISPENQRDIDFLENSLDRMKAENRAKKRDK